MRTVLLLAVAGIGLGCSVPNVNFVDAGPAFQPDSGQDGGPPSPFCTDINNGPFPDGSTVCCAIGMPCFGRCNHPACAGCNGCKLCCSGACCP
jgi:hypothetical protein